MLSAVSNTVTAATQAGGHRRGCSITPTVQTQWGTGYVIEPARVTNTGTATINGWTVTFTLPAGHSIVGSWNTVLTVNGQTVTARNVSHNGNARAGWQRHVRLPGEPSERQHAVAERLYLRVTLMRVRVNEWRAALATLPALIS